MMIATTRMASILCTTLTALLWRLLTFSSVSLRRLMAPRLSMPIAHGPDQHLKRFTRSIVFFSSKDFDPDSEEGMDTH